jgi:hypothetical protein
MLLLAILGYYRLFHVKLFLSIRNYFLAILNNFNMWILVVPLLGLLVVINVY